MLNTSQGFQIGGRLLGPGQPAFLVAEMSGNHGGSLDRALEIIRAAKRIGADAIKLQTYSANTITLKSDQEDFRMRVDSPWAQYRTLWDLYQEAATPWQWHEQLFAEAHKLGFTIFSSPFDETAVDLLEDLQVTCYKVASPEITHIPLLRRIASTGKPVIISTGVCSLEDIELALATLRDAGVENIMVLKCTTAYPSPPNESNLVTIPDIVRRFGVLSGLSDHSNGITAALTAVALGASLIEKHFTLDDESETVDSFFSSGEAEFGKLVREVRMVEQLMGKVSYEVAPSALSSLRGRRSIYICSDVAKGTALTRDHVQVVRPSFGLHPRHYEEILGRTVKRDLKRGDRLSWDDI